MRRLYQAYETYLAPPPESAYHPVSVPRASLTELPYKLTQVARIVDGVRQRKFQADHEDRQETKKTRSMLEKAGIPT